MRVGISHIGLYLAALVCLLSSCTRTNYVPVESVRTEYKDREIEKLVTDTVRDTHFVWVKGDTVVIIKEKEKTTRLEVHDTCYIERVDTIRVPYPVEKSLTKWQQTKMNLGGVSICLITLAVCVAVGWLATKFRK